MLLRSDDSIKFYLNYDDDNYEDIYADFAFTICKYYDYNLNPGEKGLVEGRVKSVFNLPPKHFSEEDNNYEFQYKQKEIESFVDDLGQIAVTVYIRMYRKIYGNQGEGSK